MNSRICRNKLFFDELHMIVQTVLQVIQAGASLRIASLVFCELCFSKLLSGYLVYCVLV